jgi:glycerol-3-phosphate cytidylyltransferase
MLREEKRHCDYLIVALQYDPTIDNRLIPKMNQHESIFERWTQVSACKYVDEVIFYATEEDLENIFKQSILIFVS